MLIRQ